MAAATPSRPGTPSTAWTHSPLSVRERAMLWFMNDVTERDDWRELVTDDRTMLVWASYLPKDGMLARTSGQATPFDGFPQDLSVGGFTPDMFMACVRELRGMAGDPFVMVLDADACVVKGSLPINEQVAQAIGQLDTSRIGAVMDPMDYPLVPVTRRHTGISRSNCLETFGMGTLIEQGSFTPIPTDVSFAADSSAQLESYVSNLHPRHEEQYAALETIVAAAMPALVTALESTWIAPRHRIPWQGAEAMVQCGTPSRCRGHCFPPQGAGSVQERLFVDAHLPRPLHPAPTAALPTPTFDAETRSWIRGRPRVQVLFRIERHAVSRGSKRPFVREWEKGLGEAVASAVVVTRAENVHATLSFRAPQGELPDIDLPVQRGSEVVRTIRELARINFYGHIEPPKWWEKDRRLYLPLGTVGLTSGKLVAWPKVLDTKLEVECTGEGEGVLELVQVLLVDPHERMMSTSEIPPQRADWMPFSDGVEETMCNLPAELRNIIWAMVEEESAPYGPEENAAYRHKMQKERAPTTQPSRTSTPSRLPTPRQNIF